MRWESDNFLEGGRMFRYAPYTIILKGRVPTGSSRQRFGFFSTVGADG